MSAERLFMPCVEGRSHQWAASRWDWDPRCTVCDEYRTELRHHHGLLCMYESGQFVPKCEFVLEREARQSISRQRSDERWAQLRAAYARADARREERQERWRQVAIERNAHLAARQELRHQRQRLREGHETLTAIRRLLRGPGVRSSLALVSEPAMSSRT